LRDRFVQDFPQHLRRNTDRSEGPRCLLLQPVRRGYSHVESSRVLACEPLNHRVGSLPLPGIEDLDFMWIRYLTDAGASPVKYDNNPDAAPILVIAQSLGKRIPRKTGPSLMQLPQFRPGEDDAMAVDDQITGLLRHSPDLPRLLCRGQTGILLRCCWLFFRFCFGRFAPRRFRRCLLALQVGEPPFPF
jgi:hypothetical protein